MRFYRQVFRMLARKSNALEAKYLRGALQKCPHVSGNKMHLDVFGVMYLREFPHRYPHCFNALNLLGAGNLLEGILPQVSTLFFMVLKLHAASGGVVSYGNVQGSF